MIQGIPMHYLNINEIGSKIELVSWIMNANKHALYWIIWYYYLDIRHCYLNNADTYATTVCTIIQIIEDHSTGVDIWIMGRWRNQISSTLSQYLIYCFGNIDYLNSECII